MIEETSLLVVNQIPEFLHVLEATLRSGYSVGQSFEIVARDIKGPIGVEVQQVLVNVQNGVSWMDALDEWLNRCPSFELDMLVATMKEQKESGGNLANKLQFIAQILPKLKHVGW